ncbi:3-deoxy-7-phosphoheptulonate synthase [Aureococcus anophagefferens]|nr:3-deoxy-7-phosphoheptulonate synthase [Aureococcus anophagefferens]
MARLAVFAATVGAACALRGPAPLRMSIAQPPGASTTSPWSPSSWRNFEAKQIPTYPDAAKLAAAEKELAGRAPLVFAGEVRTLQEELGRACMGDGFVLFGGDCAESFDEFSVDHVRDTFRVILQMALVMTYGGAQPVIKIGRMAGQFAKPRSNPQETIDGVTLPSYQGDNINCETPFTAEARAADPDRMVKAYHQCSQTLNILRAFSSGGYADISRLHNWNLDFVEQTNPGALTRQDSTTGRFYDCSAHLLWVGERTRQPEFAHFEFIRGIQNPVGVKISDKATPEDVIKILDTFNPKNIPGKVTLITRMNAKNLREKLPPLIRAVQAQGRAALWVSDPVHGNGYTSENGFKTRNFDDIRAEIDAFFDVHAQLGTHAGGVHLEMTGKDVTECLGGDTNAVTMDGGHGLSTKYLTHCDPRLNSMQSLELAFTMAAPPRADGPPEPPALAAPQAAPAAAPLNEGHPGQSARGGARRIHGNSIMMDDGSDGPRRTC